MPRQISLLYSPTGGGKTTLFGTFARGLFDTTGKRSRVYTADGGAWLDKDLTESGAVEVWYMSRPTYPFERLREICQGAWPVDAEDPDSPIIPAIAETKYVAQCPQCSKLRHDATKLPAAVPVMCPDCKRPVALKMRRKLNEANGIQNIGAVFYEGLTAFSEMLMDNMSMRSARGEKMGEEAAVKFVDGAEQVAGSSRSSYGIAQRRPKAAVEESRLLPVDYVWWSARLNRGTDDERRMPVYGPKLAGLAATDEAPAWFGPTLALVTCPLPISQQHPQGSTERRLYLRDFYQSWNAAIKDVVNLANARIPAHRLADKFKIGTRAYDSVPEYIVCDPSNRTMLWDVMQMIEERQGLTPLVPAPAKAVAPAPAATKGAA